MDDVKREDEHTHRCHECGAFFTHKPPDGMTYESYALTPQFVKSHTCEECGTPRCFVIVQPGDESATQEEWKTVVTVFDRLIKEGYGRWVNSTRLLKMVRANAAC